MGSAKVTCVPGAWLASRSAMRALPPATAGHSPVAVSGVFELCELLFPHLAGPCVEQVRPAGEGVVMQARSLAAGAACPACGAWSSRGRARGARLAAVLDVAAHRSALPQK